MGSSAVTGMGTASVTHHTSMKDARAMTFQASRPKASGAGVNNKTKKAPGPKKRPICLDNMDGKIIINNH
jgi:hypothetical protein